VHVAKPKRKTTRQTVGKVSRRKVSGAKRTGSPAGSGRGAGEGGKPAKDPKSAGEAPTIITPYLGENTPPTLPGLVKIGVSDDRGKPRQLSLPVYGNYCGVGHGDPTGNTPPIDAVDAVCREHDLCYARLGDFDSRCDQAFVESMPSAIAKTPSQAGKKAGLLALLYFSLAERNLALGETLFKRPDTDR
jgi:phospholipase A2-like protein